MSALRRDLLHDSSSDFVDLPRPGRDAAALCRDFRRYLVLTLGRDPWSHDESADYQALVLAVRDRLMIPWKETLRRQRAHDSRRTYYLSMEFLMGRALSNALLNVDLEEPVRGAMTELGLRLEELAAEEPDAALGNGGLGRLAACFLDSCATLDLPVVGYGLRYEYGTFRQRIENGRQVEEPEHWLLRGNPWEVERPELGQIVRFGGSTELRPGPNGRLQVCWSDTEDVFAVPYDTPVPGYRNGTVNTLRLWKARGTDKFSLAEFNAGDYTAAVTAKNRAENLSMVLYPSDESENGRQLRLRQQYFLASASLKDVLRRWIRDHGPDFSQFAEKSCFQLNDTHPTVAIPELMRLLMDGQGLAWEEAWRITTATMAYTNHTLLPEALERWPLAMFRQLLPRVTEIVEEIDARFLARVAERWPDEPERRRRMAIVERPPQGSGEPWVRMAHLGLVGSRSVNGVARLHSELLRDGIFRDFYELWPERFNNKTNGVTPRRWLAGCNPRASALITEAIGDGWVTDLPRLEGLRPFADDPAFRERWREVKRENKRVLAKRVRNLCGVEPALDALFDVQVKRIHEYKRQLLNTLHVIHLYDRIKRGDLESPATGAAEWTPRCVLLAGKAAPSYWMAKSIIELIHAVAAVVNADPDVGDLLQVAFLPDYRVSLMEIICPATELSEQISLAGKEASGTGNMKLMMNGALTIGTLDGANVEILDAVGEEHFFRFGLTAPEVDALRPGHDPRARIAEDRDLARVIDLLARGHFPAASGSDGGAGAFSAILHQLTDGGDPWMITADFRSYVDAQERAARAYRDAEAWTRSSILNTACSGAFSSDRTIEDYNREIWRLERLPASPTPQQSSPNSEPTIPTASPSGR